MVNWCKRKKNHTVDFMKVVLCKILYEYFICLFVILLKGQTDAKQEIIMQFILWKLSCGLCKILYGYFMSLIVIVLKGQTDAKQEIIMQFILCKFSHGLCLTVYKYFSFIVRDKLIQKRKYSFNWYYEGCLVLNMIWILFACWYIIDEVWKKDFIKLILKFCFV